MERGGGRAAAPSPRRQLRPVERGKLLEHPAELVDVSERLQDCAHEAGVSQVAQAHQVPGALALDLGTLGGGGGQGRGRGRRLGGRGGLSSRHLGRSVLRAAGGGATGAATRGGRRSRGRGGSPPLL